MMKRIAIFLVIHDSRCNVIRPCVGRFPLSLRETTIEDQILEYAEKHLPQSGVINGKCGRICYSKVDDAYIRSLFLCLRQVITANLPIFAVMILRGRTSASFMSEKEIA